MYENLYKKIQKCCGYVNVILDNEIISQGTCFSYTQDGEVLTAAHVVTGRYPIRVEDYTDPNVKIFVKFPGRPLLEYRVVFCGIDINCEAFTETIQLDIAALIPKSKQQPDFSFLPARVDPPSLGEQVFLSGYSDDLFLPFSIDKIAKKDFPGNQDFIIAMDNGYLADMTNSLIKRAYIGNLVPIFTQDFKQSINLEVDTLYLDNGMNNGASGGPVVNENGDAIGIITQRAITDASQASISSLKVPSGATIALSLRPLVAVRQLITKK